MALQWKASSTDVNVISWNKLTPSLLVSGDDEGVLRVWDMRSVSQQASATGSKPIINQTSGAIFVAQPTPVAQLVYHKHPITSVEWHPNESSIFAATVDDNQTTIWDLSIEPDAEQQRQELNEEIDLPPQVLFAHMVRVTNVRSGK